MIAVPFAALGAVHEAQRPTGVRIGAQVEVATALGLLV